MDSDGRGAQLQVDAGVPETAGHLIHQDHTISPTDRRPCGKVKPSVKEDPAEDPQASTGFSPF